MQPDPRTCRDSTSTKGIDCCSSRTGCSRTRHDQVPNDGKARHRRSTTVPSRLLTGVMQPSPSWPLMLMASEPHTPSPHDFR